METSQRRRARGAQPARVFQTTVEGPLRLLDIEDPFRIYGCLNVCSVFQYTPIVQYYFIQNENFMSQNAFKKKMIKYYSENGL